MEDVEFGRNYSAIRTRFIESPIPICGIRRMRRMCRRILF